MAHKYPEFPSVTVPTVEESGRYGFKAGKNWRHGTAKPNGPDVMREYRGNTAAWRAVCADSLDAHNAWHRGFEAGFVENAACGNLVGVTHE